MHETSLHNSNAAMIFSNIAQCNVQLVSQRFVLISQLKRSIDSRESSMVAIAKQITKIIAQ